ncbi:hypothetical protein [Paraburkholderia elongata]|uniref:Uncharacterized protein n=1 Tax=Paraburkholderia elongata TaxID=2675747 RepID=A0A972NQM6_9BURK|nr:hypothetical protein [Paraburkholderia elongata]NPT55880.1 hypothetical protein [Paraburkholderia elongata]NPT59224.1 hypothetical protein [Paraburkholderia elongata]
MANHPPYSMVLTYTEDPKQLIMQAVNSARLAPVVRGIMEVPFFLDDEEFKFDDELARQLGVAMLNTIALGRPDIKQHLNVTPHPIDKPNSAEGIDGD